MADSLPTKWSPVQLQAERKTGKVCRSRPTFYAANNRVITALQQQTTLTSTLVTGDKPPPPGDNSPRDKPLPKIPPGGNPQTFVYSLRFRNGLVTVFR